MNNTNKRQHKNACPAIDICADPLSAVQCTHVTATEATSGDYLVFVESGEMIVAEQHTELLFLQCGRQFTQAVIGQL